MLVPFVGVDVFCFCFRSRCDWCSSSCHWVCIVCVVVAVLVVVALVVLVVVIGISLLSMLSSSLCVWVAE